MYLHEAVSAAMAGGFFVTRAHGADWQGLKIRPTDTPSCCEMHMLHRGGVHVAKRWNPQAADLIADDWVVVS